MSVALLRLCEPIVGRLAPASRFGMRVRWEALHHRLVRAITLKRFDQIDALLDGARTLLEGMAAWDPDVVTRLNLIGDHYHEVAGDNRRAEATYRSALSIAESRSLREGIAQSLNNLSLLLLRQSRAEEAEALLRRLLGLLEEAEGKGHRETGVCLENLSAALRQQGRNQEAAEARRRAAEATAGAARS